MSQHRKQRGKMTRISHPTGSSHEVYEMQPHGMTVATYNDDGSFTGTDGLRYVDRTVLLQRDARED